MEASEFFMLIEQLTGTAIKDVGENDKRDLAKALRDDGRRVDWTQFNELLLLVNKDRVEAPFFERYFRPSCMVAEISAGVTRFQKDAMRRYGNFIFAYRKLSKMPTRKALESELGELCVAPHDLEVELKGRSPKLLEIEPIDRGDTYLVGYLSAEQITTENSYADLLLEHSSLSDTWDALDKLNDSCREDARPYVCAVVEKYRSRNPQSGPDDFAAWLKETRPHLESLDKQLEVVQYRALRNQDVYLTWDHMDVYFATSMRKRDEYEDLYDFVNKLMAVERLAELNIRYFDPTQSFTPNRVDKGLVEALMLRRAKCTVYSIQDTDTLGKDSELASTLAQGKPVIAYVPRVDIAARAELLFERDPANVLDRLTLLRTVDSKFRSSITADDRQFVHDFTAILNRYHEQRIWMSLPDEDEAAQFRANHREDLKRLCRLLAASEARLYDSRARTLKSYHPLGVQVQLETGVANGVLVVREIAQCAEVLRRILTNSLEFEVRHDKDMWYLREVVSQSSFRVVTNNRKLTNCFWNFYMAAEHGM